MKLAYIFAFVISVSIQLAGNALAEKRIALVIGNDNYENLQSSQQLKKARNDATAVGDALEAVGFKVIRVLDASRRRFNLKLHELARQIEPGDTAAVFYAGHGVRINGANYLLPSDIPFISNGQEDLLISEAINTERIIDQIRQKGAKVTLLILDSCRNNPFLDKNGRSIGGARGLAIMEPPESTFVLYSAGANQIALDRLSNFDENPNSVFTRVLLPYLSKADLEISDLAKQVRREVRSLALNARGHNQTPAVYNDLIEDFYLSPKAGIQSVNKQRKASAYSDRNVEIAYWNTVKNSKISALFESYLNKFPTGEFADLANIKIASLSPPTGNLEKSQSVIPSTPKVQRPVIPSLTIVPGQSDKSPWYQDRLDLVRNVQRELNRVGCNVGKVDGKWGPKSSSALSRAQKFGGIDFPSAEPTVKTLELLKLLKKTTCTRSCSAGKEVRSGQCVVIACAAGQRRSRKGRCYTPKRKTASCKAGYRKNSSGTCYKKKRRKKIAKKQTTTAKVAKSSKPSPLILDPLKIIVRAGRAPCRNCKKKTKRSKSPDQSKKSKPSIFAPLQKLVKSGHKTCINC